MSNQMFRSFVTVVGLFLALQIAACGDDSETTPDEGAPAQPTIGPNVGVGDDPKRSPVNIASAGNIHVHLTAQDVAIDGVIDEAEWQECSARKGAPMINEQIVPQAAINRIRASLESELCDRRMSCFPRRHANRRSHYTRKRGKQIVK